MRFKDEWSGVKWASRGSRSRERFNPGVSRKTGQLRIKKLSNRGCWKQQLPLRLAAYQPPLAGRKNREGMECSQDHKLQYRPPFLLFDLCIYLRLVVNSEQLVSVGSALLSSFRSFMAGWTVNSPRRSCGRCSVTDSVLVFESSLLFLSILWYNITYIYEKSNYKLDLYTLNESKDTAHLRLDWLFFFQVRWMRWKLTSVEKGSALRPDWTTWKKLKIPVVLYYTLAPLLHAPPFDCYMKLWRYGMESKSRN